MYVILWVAKYCIGGYIPVNSFGSWWNTTITIYNKFEDPQTQVVRWFRHVVHDAFWKDTGNKITIGNVTIDTNNIICRIREDDAFLEKARWLEIPNDEMGNYFTLGVGDIIVKGEVDDEIDEYTSGHRATDLTKKYKQTQSCMEIQQWSDNTGGGRGNQHYYASGK